MVLDMGWEYLATSCVKAALLVGRGMSLGVGGPLSSPGSLQMMGLALMASWCVDMGES